MTLFVIPLAPMVLFLLCSRPLLQHSSLGSWPRYRVWSVFNSRLGYASLSQFSHPSHFPASGVRGIFGSYPCSNALLAACPTLFTLLLLRCFLPFPALICRSATKSKELDCKRRILAPRVLGLQPWPIK